MKKDISKLKFGSIIGWRGDSLVCPQAFGGDIFSGCSMGCWWCFCREMDHELFNKYYTGWHRELVRSCDPDDYKKVFDKAFGSDKDYQDWSIKCLRHGLPFNMGSKAETFCIEDHDHKVVEKVLRLFIEYKVPVIFQTKSHYVGLKRYLDLIKQMKAAVIVSIMGGSDTLNYKLEPGAPPPSMRWLLVKELNEAGIWTAVRWEPILIGINSTDEIFEGYRDNCIKSQAKHVSFYNYRSTMPRLAKEEFEKRGFDYIKLLKNNLDDNWINVGKRFFTIMKSSGIRVSTPDFINFPFDSSCESCCGVDDLFTPYSFTFMKACKIIDQKGSISWNDMEAIDFKEPKAYDRMKKIWNKGRQYYSLVDSPGVMILDKDKNGYHIYGKKDNSKIKKVGLLW